jgi:hypothetical protein
MRISLLAAGVAALLVPATPALAAGDPIMPLSQVQPGMRCTAYSVVRGTEISSFDAEVLDVVADDVQAQTADGPRILLQFSGPAVDATGLGPGFSGSPIYCPDAAGVMRNIGAISESIGEYGGKVALATPIEEILGTPVDPPSKPAAAKDSGHASIATAAWEHDLLAKAKPMAEPLVISGVSSSVISGLQVAAQKAGRQLLAAPAGPAGNFPVQTLRPGSAVSTGYSSGDVRVSAVGTVAYTDGPSVWAFGHALEDAGARALLLQDAYVFRVVNNPLQYQTAATYKLAAPGHDLGTLTNDTADAVAGRVGALPHTVPVTVLARDTDTKKQEQLHVQVADESAVDFPSGGSWTSSVAPLTLVQAATDVLGSTPGRVTGEMCARISLQELKKPLRFCDRYVSLAQEQGDDGSLGDALTTGAAGDLANALASIDAYTGKPPRVTGVSVLLTMHRGADQAYITHVHVPARVRSGEKIPVTLTLQRDRGNTFQRTYQVQLPKLHHGHVKLRLAGRDADTGDDSLGTTIIIGGDTEDDNAGDPGPTSLSELASQVEANARWDGVTYKLGNARGRAFRDASVRISGHGEATLHVG